MSVYRATHTGRKHCKKEPWLFSHYGSFHHPDLQSLNKYTFFLVHQGASTVKWTTLDPCSGLSESDPKLYTNFEFYEIEIHKHLENI